MIQSVSVIVFPRVRTCNTSDIISIAAPLTFVPPLGESYITLLRTHRAERRARSFEFNVC
jgi:hypothetical protein